MPRLDGTVIGYDPTPWAQRAAEVIAARVDTSSSCWLRSRRPSIAVGGVAYAGMSRPRPSALASRPIATAVTAPPTTCRTETTAAGQRLHRWLPHRRASRCRVGRRLTCSSSATRSPSSPGRRSRAAAAPTGAQVVNAAMEGCGVMAGTPLHYVGNEQQQPDGCDDWPTRWQVRRRLLVARTSRC